MFLYNDHSHILLVLTEDQLEDRCIAIDDTINIFLPLYYIKIDVEFHFATSLFSH